MSNELVHLHRGSIPLLISLPHDGTGVPDDIAQNMTDAARLVPDTDWFVSQLYEFAVALGASVLRPSQSRYVIDLNRPPDDVSLYPGQNTTGLCPIVQFSGEPIYLPGCEPTLAEIARRRYLYWDPYHRALAAELARLNQAHGRVLLWEGHSIRSRVPFLFDGRLPDINLGTAVGTSCVPAVQHAIEAALGAQSDYSWVSNGRFKGGFITRQYGRSSAPVDAVQLELAQCNYMDEGRALYEPERAARVQVLLRRLIEAALSAQTSPRV